MSQLPLLANGRGWAELFSPSPWNHFRVGICGGLEQEVVLDCWGAAEDKTSISQVLSLGLTCSVLKTWLVLVHVDTVSSEPGPRRCLHLISHSSFQPPSLSTHSVCHTSHSELQSVTFPSSSLCFSHNPLFFFWLTVFQCSSLIFVFFYTRWRSINFAPQDANEVFYFFCIFKLPFRVD